VIENALFAATGAKTYDAPIEEVLAYYAANRGSVAIISGLQRPHRGSYRFCG
jgi:hypothetical protein